MLAQCWPTVYDGGPTLSQHRRSANAGSMLAHRLRRWANIEPAWVDISCLLDTPFSLHDRAEPDKSTSPQEYTTQDQ